MKPFHERFGENFKDSNPEVFKKGILNKAERQFNKGEYKPALNTLMEGFRIHSLLKEKDAAYAKKDKARIAKETAESGTQNSQSSCKPWRRYIS